MPLASSEACLVYGGLESDFFLGPPDPLDGLVEASSLANFALSSLICLDSASGLSLRSLAASTNLLAKCFQAFQTIKHALHLTHVQKLYYYNT